MNIISIWLLMALTEYYAISHYQLEFRLYRKHTHMLDEYY